MYYVVRTYIYYLLGIYYSCTRFITLLVLLVLQVKKHHEKYENSLNVVFAESMKVDSEFIFRRSQRRE